LVNGDGVHYFALMIINGDIIRKVLVHRIYFIYYLLSLGFGE
jgi:hypothetical protein